MFGDIAFDRGTFSFDVSLVGTDGPFEHVTGKYLWLLRRRGDAWKLTRHRQRRRGYRVIRPAIAGAIVAILLSFPCAAAIALIYRFPIPFGGYASGIDAVPLAMMAVGFYGVTFGGFVVVGVLGGVVAALVARRLWPGRRSSRGMILIPSFVIAFCATFTLAILDKLIGSW